jgi:hypothetical protein
MQKEEILRLLVYIAMLKGNKQLLERKRVRTEPMLKVDGQKL